MKTKRAHIWLPTDLIREIDALVGPRGRSAFLAETAREAVRRRKLLKFLQSAPPLSSETEPASAAWVRQLRRQSDRQTPAKIRRKRK